MAGPSNEKQEKSTAQKLSDSLKLFIYYVLACTVVLACLHALFIVTFRAQPNTCPYVASDIGITESTHFFTFSSLDSVIYTAFVSAWTNMRYAFIHNALTQSIALLLPVLSVSVLGIFTIMGLVNITLRDLARNLAMIIGPSWILFTSSGNQILDLFVNFFIFTSGNTGIIGTLANLGNEAITAITNLTDMTSDAMATINASAMQSQDPYFMMDTVAHIILSETIFWKIYATPFLFLPAPVLIYILYRTLLTLLRVMVAIIFTKIVIFVSIQLLPLFMIFIPAEEIANFGKSPNSRAANITTRIFNNGILSPTIYLILLFIFLGIFIRIFILSPLVGIFNFTVCSYKLLNLLGGIFDIVPFIGALFNVYDYYPVLSTNQLQVILFNSVTLFGGIFLLPGILGQFEAIAQSMSGIAGGAVGNAISGGEDIMSGKKGIVNNYANDVDGAYENVMHGKTVKGADGKTVKDKNGNDVKEGPALLDRLSNRFAGGGGMRNRMAQMLRGNTLDAAMDNEAKETTFKDDEDYESKIAKDADEDE